MLEKVMAALTSLRCPFAAQEVQLHEAVAACLERAGIPFEHEVRLGKGCRIDFLAGDVGIEIKKAKPDAVRARNQLARYADIPGITALVFIAPGNVPLPDCLNGKPVRKLSLNHLWGISLP